MKNDFNFIEENSHTKKMNILIFLACFIILFVGVITVLLFIWSRNPQTISFWSLITDKAFFYIKNTTPFGLFFSHFIGGIFFVPSADELIFIYGLLNGNSIVFSFVAAITGYVLAQVVNYFLGAKLSSYILPLVSKKKVYKIRTKINNYGVYAVFLFNFLPLPAPLLTFALGITKYNKYRLFAVILLSKVLEYIVLIILFLLISK